MTTIPKRARARVVQRLLRWQRTRVSVPPLGSYFYQSKQSGFQPGAHAATCGLGECVRSAQAGGGRLTRGGVQAESAKINGFLARQRQPLGLALC